MRIEFVTLFPRQVEMLADFGVVGRAVERGLLELGTVDPREFATDAHRTVDDRPYGGGPGMVMTVAPLRAAIDAARERLPAASPCVVLSPQGRLLEQGLVNELARAPGLLLVAGRYEGIDERVIALEADYEVSVGDYVLSGGELPALVLADAVARRVDGVLGDAESAMQDSFEGGLLDCPHYTRPEQVGGNAGAAGAVVGRPRGDPALAPPTGAGTDLAATAGPAGKAAAECGRRGFIERVHRRPSGQWRTRKSTGVTLLSGGCHEQHYQ